MSGLRQRYGRGLAAVAILFFSLILAPGEAWCETPSARSAAQTETTKAGKALSQFVADEEAAEQRAGGKARGGMTLGTRSPSGDPLLDLPAPMPELWDEETLKRYLEAVRGGLDYRLHGYRHRRDVFAWQLFSSKMIFWIVLLLVLAGMYFAAVQFHVGLSRSRREGGEEQEETEFVASLKGLKVKSPVLGVVILVISLAFFYLYLVYVYPIREIL